MKKEMLVVAALVVAGCVTIPEGGNQPVSNIEQMVGASNRVAVCIGLTSVDPRAYQGWAGDCPGCDVDAKGLYGLFLNNGFSASLVLNSAATCMAFALRSWMLPSVSRLVIYWLLRCLGTVVKCLITTVMSQVVRTPLSVYGMDECVMTTSLS